MKFCESAEVTARMFDKVQLTKIIQKRLDESLGVFFVFKMPVRVTHLCV